MKFSTVTIIFAISAADSRSITMVSARADSKAGKSKAPKAKASKVNHHAGGRASYSFSSTLSPTLSPTISPVSNLLSYHLTSVYKQTITLPLYLTTHLHTLQTFNRRWAQRWAQQCRQLFLRWVICSRISYFWVQTNDHSPLHLYLTAHLHTLQTFNRRWARRWAQHCRQLFLRWVIYSRISYFWVQTNNHSASLSLLIPHLCTIQILL